MGRRAQRHAGLALLVGFALALALAAPAAQATVDPLLPVSGTSPFAPACNGAPQPQASVEYRNSEVEPWIDANPTNGDNLVAMWQQDRWSDGGANGLGVARSADGGRSWTPVPLASLPQFTRCQGAAAGSAGDYERASDPWFSFAPDGDGYASSLSFNESRDLANAILVSESRDGGSTWGPVQTILRDTSPAVFNDKETITADPTDARYVYVVWNRLESFANAFKGPIWFARTTDGGATWEPAKAIFDPGVNASTVGNQIVGMPDGDLVNGYSLFRGASRSVAVMRSSDKGVSWAPQVLVSSHETVGVSDPRNGDPVRTGDIVPELAADERPGTDTVYMVWQDARFNEYHGDQIILSKSSDGGATWSAPRRISTVPGTQAFTPSIRVDAAGNLGVTYYDFRYDSVNSQSLDTDLWFLRSTDGGATFTEERLTSSSFDMRAAPVARGFFVGDYTGLASAGLSFKPAFSMTGSGGTDVFAGNIRPPFGPSTPPTPTAPGAPAGRPAAPVTPPQRSLRVGSRGRLGRRFATLRLRCLAARCAGRVELSAVLSSRGRRRLVILGSRSYRIGRGRFSLQVRLNRRVRALTARRRRLAVRALFTMRADRFRSRVLLRR